MKKKTIFTFLAVFALLAACAGTQQSMEQRAYQALYTSKATYDLTMESVADLQAQGLIDEVDRARINDEARKYYQVHMAAANALYQAKLLNDYSQLPDHLQGVEMALTLLLEVARPVLLKGGI